METLTEYPAFNETEELWDLTIEPDHRLVWWREFVDRGNPKKLRRCSHLILYRAVLEEVYPGVEYPSPPQ